MKQYITVTQLQELSYAARDKLTFYLESTGTLRADYRDNDFCEHVNIGQMIEFLGEHYGYIPLGILGDGNFQLETDCGEAFRELLQPEEWCDTLWEAVKEVLGKE